MRATGALVLSALVAVGCSGPGGLPELDRLERQPVPNVEPVDGDALRDALATAGIDVAGLRPLHEDPEGVTWHVVVAGGDSLDTWKALRGVVPDTGRWPVIVGDADRLDEVRELAILEERSVADLLRAAEVIDVEEWTTARQRDDPDFYSAAEGRWHGRPNTTIATTTDILTGRPLARVAIALVPTPRSWEAPAWLRFGGWNACPLPDEHVAVFRRWHRQHGTEVVALTTDIAELAVTDIPSERDAARALAREHFIYCGDLVHQGTVDLEPLAATILNGTTWSFWWD